MFAGGNNIVFLKRVYYGCPKSQKKDISNGLQTFSSVYILFKNRVVSQESQRFRTFTVRKRSCGKVMFSQACVKNSVRGGGGVHPPGQTPSGRPPSPYADTLLPGQVDTPLGRHPSWAGRHPPEQTPPPADGCCSGRYASYWNAFLVTVKNRRKAVWKGTNGFLYKLIIALLQDFGHPIGF